MLLDLDLHSDYRCCFIEYSWITQLLTQSHKKGTLDLTDLYDVPSHLESTKLTDKMEANWFDEMKRSPQKPNLIRATIRTMGWKPLLIGLLLIPLVSIQLMILFDLFNVSSVVIIKHCTTISTHSTNELLRTMFNNV
jgi:hypothetical protein